MLKVVKNSIKNLDENLTDNFEGDSFPPNDFLRQEKYSRSPTPKVNAEIGF